MPQRVKVTGGSLAVDIEGEGPPVVLVHAGVCDARQWEAVSRELSRHRTVVRYDRRGYGRTKTTKRGRFGDQLDLLELVDALELERPVVCGSSAGAAAVLEAAALAPGRFERMVLLAPPLWDWDWGEQMIAYDEAETAALDKGDFDTAVQLNLDMWVRVPEHREPVSVMLRRAFENQRDRPFAQYELDPPVTERFGDIQGPVRIMVGEHDSGEFKAIARFLAERLPGARAEEVPDAGHLLGLERPEVVVEALY
jgi:pimeloyl-ACP methyl ester carboxylesterase